MIPVKILLDPVYTHRYMSGCSTYYALKLCGLRILDRFPEAFIYCLVPDEKNPNTVLFADEQVQDPRWTNLPIFYSKDRNEEMLYPSDELKDTISNWSNICWDWDVLITTRNNGEFFETIKGKRRFFPMKRMILIEPFPMFSFKKTYCPRRYTDLRFLTSYMHFDKIFIQTEWERREVMELARKWLTPSYVRELGQKITVAFPTEFSYQEPVKRNDTNLQVIYCQRLDEAERKVSRVMETIWYSFVQNSYKIRFHISTNGLSGMPSDDKKFIIFGRLPRQEFWEKLKKMDVWISWSIEEGMPFALLEACYFGVIGVCRRTKWSEDFFGKDYFGLVDSVDEAIGVIKWVHDNRDLAWEKFMEWYRGHFKDYLTRKGVQFDEMNKYIDDYWQSVEQRVKTDFEFEKSRHPERTTEDVRELSLAADLDNECKHRIDFAQRREFEEERKSKNTPFYRRRDFWHDRLKLLFNYGWKDNKDCGVLERKYR